MRPAHYTDDQIIQAGKQIQTDHPERRITASAIRTALGGGNLTRIRTVWESYRQGEMEAKPTAFVELPAQFQQDLEGMVEALASDLRVLATRIYGRATEIAERQMQDALKGAQAAQEIAEAELAEASDALEAADQHKADLTEKLAAAQSRIRTLEASESWLTTRLEEVELAREAAIGERDHLAHEVNTLREAVTTQRTRAEGVKEQLDETKATLKVTATEKATAERQAAEHETRATDLQQRLDSALIEQKALGREAHQAALMATEQRTRAEGLETQLKAAQASAAQVPRLEQRIQELARALKKLKAKPGDNPS